MVGTLVEDFAAEVRAILARENLFYQNEKGERQLPGVYAHALPPAARGKPNRTPWVLVALYNGEQASGDDPLSAKLHITNMVYDASESMQGGRDALGIIGAICRNLYAQSFVAGKYEVLYPYQFAVLDDVTYPYFAAGLAIPVQLAGAAPQNKEDYAYA